MTVTGSFVQLLGHTELDRTRADKDRFSCWREPETETVGPLRSPVKVSGAETAATPGRVDASAIMLRPLIGRSTTRRESISVPTVEERLSTSGASAVTATS